MASLEKTFSTLIRAGVMASVFFSLLGQLGRIPLFRPGVYLSVYEFFLLFTILVSIPSLFRQKRAILSLPFVKPLISFMAISFLSLLINPLNLSPVDWFTAFLYLVRYLGYTLLYPIVILAINNDELRRKRFLAILFASGVIFGVVGFIQYFLYPDLRNVYYLGWDPHQYRLFSTLFDPNFTGLILLLTIFVGWEIFQGVARGIKKGTIALALILTCIAFLLTYSRSSYIAFLISFPFLAKSKPIWKMIVLVYAIFLISIVSLPRPFGEGVRLERMSSSFARVESYQQTVAIIQRYPVFGVGFNALRYAKQKMGFLNDEDWQTVHSGSGSDNSFLFVWATSGIFGFLSFLWFCFSVLQSTWKTKFILASFVAMLTHAFFVNSFFYPLVMLWMWLLLGMHKGLGSIRQR